LISRPPPQAAGFALILHTTNTKQVALIPQLAVVAHIAVIIPLRSAWQMPPTGASCHGRLPIVQPAILCTVGYVILITSTALCIVIQIFRHPYLTTYCYTGVSLTIADIIKFVVATAIGTTGTTAAATTANRRTRA